jgi:hypothetical protein
VKKKSELSYGNLVVDNFDAGQPIYASIARQIFVLRDDDFEFEFAHVDWDTEEEHGGSDYPWCDKTNQERGRFWSIVYRYYPRRSYEETEI